MRYVMLVAQFCCRISISYNDKGHFKSWWLNLFKVWMEDAINQNSHRETQMGHYLKLLNLWITIQKIERLFRPLTELLQGFLTCYFFNMRQWINFHLHTGLGYVCIPYDPAQPNRQSLRDRWAFYVSWLPFCKDRSGWKAKLIVCVL